MLCIALIGSLASSCTSGSHSFLIVQTCLVDVRGVEDFVGEMRAIASAEHMEFLDANDQVARQLRSANSPLEERSHGSRIVDVSVQRADGMGVTAVNHGLPAFEIALGFSEGRDAESARAFADRVVARLGSRWPLTQVPSGMGAKPRGGCP